MSLQQPRASELTSRSGCARPAAQPRALSHRQVATKLSIAAALRPLHSGWYVRHSPRTVWQVTGPTRAQPCWLLQPGAPRARTLRRPALQRLQRSSAQQPASGSLTTLRDQQHPQPASYWCQTHRALQHRTLSCTARPQLTASRRCVKCRVALAPVCSPHCAHSPLAAAPGGSAAYRL